ncbi:MAG: hypothetical protein PHZ00_07860 [Candidatus Peribacteraceae bacterium]|nr:hypothetical protein [Candidatus Peribacteraceae bacterium]
MAMHTAEHTPSAEALDTVRIDQVQEFSRQRALEIAAEKGARVKDVQEIQRAEFYRELVGEAEGGDGAATPANIEVLKLQVSEDVQKVVEERTEEDHNARMEVVEPTPDAYVLKPEGNIAGVQHDDSREVGIAPQALDDPSVPEHEHAHQLQETGNATLELPVETGEKVLDEAGQVERRENREDDAMNAESGGETDRPAEYVRYQEVADAERRLLNDAGKDGNRLVEQAAKTQEGFVQMHQELVHASIMKRYDLAV